MDDAKLGGWKLEATGSLLGIAGKKLYTLVDELSPDWIERQVPVKKASKGVRLEAEQILEVARGHTVVYPNPVPVFKLGTDPSFITRRVRATGKAART